MTKPVVTLTPLAAWLLLTVAIATLFPVPSTILQLAWVIGLVIFTVSVLSPRQWLVVAATAGIPILALLLPIPLPDWPILVRLVVILGLWLTLLTVATTLATVYNQTHE